MDFGYVIKEQRKNIGISLREAAKRTGISHPYLSQLENGKTKNPTREVIKKLSVGLGISYAFLLETAGYFEGVSNNELDRLKNILNDLRYDDNHLCEKILELKSKKDRLNKELVNCMTETVDLQSKLRELREREESVEQQMALVVEKIKEKKPVMPNGIVFGIGIGNGGDSTFTVFKDGIEVTDRKEKELLFKKHQLAFENSFIREGKILEEQRKKTQD